MSDEVKKDEMKVGRKLSVEIDENDEPQVKITGDGWKSADIRAIKQMIDRAYRRWQKQQRKRELARMNNTSKGE